MTYEEEQLQDGRNRLVVQANDLVRAKKDDLTVMQARIVRLAISQVLKGDTDFYGYVCNAEDLARFLGMEKQHDIYRQLLRFNEDMMRKAIVIYDGTTDRKGKPNYRAINWFEYAEYKDGVIRLKLHSNLRKYILDLKETFTLYPYDAVVSLPTNNAILLYELIASYQNMVVRGSDRFVPDGITLQENELPALSIEYLREYFDCIGKYKNTGDFCIKVLDPAVKAIRENTRMQLSYRKAKPHGYISHIVFALDDMMTTPAEQERLEKIRKIYPDAGKPTYQRGQAAE